MIDCSKCPANQECCGILIFDLDFFKENEKSIEPKEIDRKIIGDKITLIYNDGRCPFLDRQTRKCKIYDKRPKVCRDYGYIEKLQCPYFKRSGNRRSQASETKILREIDRQVEKVIRK